MARKPRPIRIEGDVAYVPLTKGYEAVIDAADVPLVEGVCWGANVHPRTVYALNNGVYMHRLLLGNPKGFEIDHVDSNGLNNRRSNLRVATKAQNQANARTTNRTGYRGVTKVSRNRWSAKIGVAGGKLHLGLFSSPEEAASAYAAASAEFYGEFGRLA